MNPEPCCDVDFEGVKTQTHHSLWVLEIQHQYILLFADKYGNSLMHFTIKTQQNILVMSDSVKAVVAISYCIVVTSSND